jgi:hypothetical protein
MIPRRVRRLATRAPRSAPSASISSSAAAIWGSISRQRHDHSRCPDAESDLHGDERDARQHLVNSSHRDFRGAPVAGHWYKQSLANKLFGSDLNVATT